MDKNEKSPRFTRNVTMDFLISSLQRVKTKYNFSGTEDIVGAMVIDSDSDEEYPYGTLLLRLREPSKDSTNEYRIGTLSIAPEKLNELLN